MKKLWMIGLLVSAMVQVHAQVQRSTPLAGTWLMQELRDSSGSAVDFGPAPGTTPVAFSKMQFSAKTAWLSGTGFRKKARWYRKGDVLTFRWAKKRVLLYIRELHADTMLVKSNVAMASGPPMPLFIRYKKKT